MSSTARASTPTEPAATQASPVEPRSVELRPVGRRVGRNRTGVAATPTAAAPVGTEPPVDPVVEPAVIAAPDPGETDSHRDPEPSSSAYVDLWLTDIESEAVAPAAIVVESSVVVELDFVPPSAVEPAGLVEASVGDSYDMSYGAPAPREVAFPDVARPEVAMGGGSVRDAITDEWGRPAELVAVSRTPTAVAELIRPGPPMLDADSWDTEPGPAVTNETYHGRRRRSKLALGRFWVVLAVVVLGLGAVASYPLLRSASGGAPGNSLDRPPGEMPFPGPTDDGIPLPTTEAPTDPGVPTIGNPPVQIARTDGPVPTASPTTPGLGIGPPTGAPSASDSIDVAPPVFTSLTIEAEAPQNVLTGSARRTQYWGASGGQMVGYVGKLPGGGTPGTLLFPDVVVPAAGTYQLTFYYAASSNRTAYISVNGAEPIKLMVGQSNKCCGVASVDIVLKEGSNTIMFSNPTSRCPAIDRIVITQPT